MGIVLLAGDAAAANSCRTHFKPSTAEITTAPQVERNLDSFTFDICLAVEISLTFDESTQAVLFSA